MKANPVRLGLIFGAFLALFHTCWVALVALGWGQALMDFVFWAHFISAPWHIEPFALARACALIGFTFAVGLVIGLAGGRLWNSFAAAR